MKDLEERIGEVSMHLQQLIEPAIFPEVQNAVEKKDKDSLVEVCRKIGIPEIHIATIVSVLLSINPRQPKWIFPY